MAEARFRSDVAMSVFIDPVELWSFADYSPGRIIRSYCVESSCAAAPVQLHWLVKEPPQLLSLEAACGFPGCDLQTADRDEDDSEGSTRADGSPDGRPDGLATGSGDDSASDGQSSRSNARGGAQQTTTLMIRNLPARLTKHDVMAELAKTGFGGRYDVCYMPLLFSTGRGKGYAFVNLTSVEACGDFKRSWHGSRFFDMTAAEPPLNIASAEVQGREQALHSYRTRKVCRIRNPRFRPFIA